MPLDTSIALGIKGPQQQQNPLAGLAALMQIVHSSNQNRTEQLKYDQLKETLPLDLAKRRLENDQATRLNDIIDRYVRGGSTQGPSLGVGGISTPGGGQENVFTGQTAAPAPQQNDYQRRLGLAELLSFVKPDMARAVDSTVKTRFPDKIREAHALGYAPGSPQFMNFVAGISSPSGIFSAPDASGNRTLDPNYAASQGAIKGAEAAAAGQYKTVEVWGVDGSGQRRKFQILESQLPAFMASQGGQTSPSPAPAPTPAQPPAPQQPSFTIDKNNPLIDGKPLTSYPPDQQAQIRQALSLQPSTATAPVADPARPVLNKPLALAGAPTAEETNFAGKVGDNDADRFKVLQEGYLSAREGLGGLKFMREQIANGAMGGRLAPGLQSAGEFLMGFGVPLDAETQQAIRSGQNFEKAASQSALSQLKSYVGAANISDADRKAVEALAPRMRDDPRARIEWIDYLEKRMKAQQELFTSAQDHARRTGSLSGWRPTPTAPALPSSAQMVSPTEVLLPNGQTKKFKNPIGAKAFFDAVNKAQ